MTTPLDQTRAEFQKWYLESTPLADPEWLRLDADGEFESMMTGEMFRAWQAAIASRWTNVRDALPPCRDDQLYLGVNSNGYAGVFNAIADIAGDVHCMYETAEESVDVMSGLAIWQPFNPPTPQDPPIAALAAKEKT